MFQKYNMNYEQSSYKDKHSRDIDLVLLILWFVHIKYVVLISKKCFNSKSTERLLCNSFGNMRV